MLRLIIMTWEGEQKSFSANMMNGVARLLNSFGDELKETTFKEKLGVVSVKDITKNAKERRPGSLGFAEAMLVVYNKRMKPGLQWSKLYSVKASGGGKKKENKEYDEDAEVEQDAS